MAKETRKLTAPGIQKLRAKKDRYERSDPDSPGLRVVVFPTGLKSFLWRYKRPGTRKSAKLTLGNFDITGLETEEEPKIGDPLTLASARLLRAKCLRDLKRGIDPGAEYLTDKERRRDVAIEKAASTFGALASQYIIEYTVPKKGRKPRDWYDRARIIGLDFSDESKPAEIKGGLAERWRDKPVSEIDGHDIHALIDEARKRGIPGLSKKTKGTSDARGRKMSDALNGVFGWLADHRKIASNPTVGVWRPSAPPKRSRVLNAKLDRNRADELRWFWAATDKITEPFGAFLKLLLLTGCRRDEIAALERGELNDDFSMISLPGERTKNGLPHDVPLPQLARDILRSVKMIKGSEYIFSTTGTSPISGFSKLKRRLDALMVEEARKERGKDYVIPAFTIHDLRRSCSSGMAGIKIAPHIVEACLNHISGAKASVAGVYNVEKYEPEKQAAFEAWAAHIQVIISGKPAKVLPLRRSK